ncbi:MAG: hypothetical protein HYT28_01015 [Parcubacteria group bacterium]|nr:hypothetical protein [Parcubacteria group bacterium]
MFSYLQKKIIAAMLVVAIISPAVLLIQPKKAEAACGFGGGGGGGTPETNPNIQGPVDTSGMIQAMRQIKPRLAIQRLIEDTPLAVSVSTNIFKSGGASTISIPQTSFDANALDGGATLALVVSEPVLQAINIAQKAIECITSIASSITSFATDSLAIKETVLDGIAYAIINQIIADMLNDIQRWAITGFKGNPVFLTNPERYFTNLADQVLGVFLNKLAGVNLCNIRWNALIEISLSIDLGYQQRAQCTFSEIGANFDRFINDFSQGGWGAWIKLTTETQNNPYGAYILATEELAKQTGTVPGGLLGKKLLELQWGKGIISLTKCTYGEISQNDVDSGYINENLPALDKSTIGMCKDARGNPDPNATSNTTPGNIIEDSINKTLGATTDRIVAADEINETMAALLYGLLVKTFSSNEGFAGADWSGISSQIGSGASNKAFADVKSEIFARVDSFTISETEFKKQKERALGVLKESEKALNEVAACYIDQITLYKQYLDPANTRLLSIGSGNPFLQFVQAEAEQKIQQSRDTLAQKITPRVAPLQNSVTQSNVFLYEIEQTRATIVSADTFNKLDEKTKIFFETRDRWDDPLEAAAAENEADSIKTEIEPITAQAKADLPPCQTTRQQMRDFFKINDIQPAA